MYRIVLAMLLLTGCHTLEKLYKAESTPPDPIPDIIVLHGFTVVDYQGFTVRCANSSVLCRIFDKEENRWRDLNPYEVKISTVGSGGGGVFFRRKCYPTYDENGRLIRLIITGKPVAPTGTEYEIKSILQSGSSSRELY